MCINREWHQKHKMKKMRPKKKKLNGILNTKKIVVAEKCLSL